MNMTMTLVILLSVAVVLLAVIAVLLYHVVRGQKKDAAPVQHGQNEVLWSRGVTRRSFVPAAVMGLLAMVFFKSAAKSMTGLSASNPPAHGDSNLPSGKMDVQHGDSNPSEQHGDSNSQVAMNREQHGDSNPSEQHGDSNSRPYGKLREQHGDSNPSVQHGDSNPSEQHGDSNSPSRG